MAFPYATWPPAGVSPLASIGIMDFRAAMAAILLSVAALMLAMGFYYLAAATASKICEVLRRRFT